MTTIALHSDSRPSSAEDAFPLNSHTIQHNVMNASARRSSLVPINNSNLSSPVQVTSAAHATSSLLDSASETLAKSRRLSTIEANETPEIYSRQLTLFNSAVDAPVAAQHTLHTHARLPLDTPVALTPQPADRTDKKHRKTKSKTRQDAPHLQLVPYSPSSAYNLTQSIPELSLLSPRSQASPTFKRLQVSYPQCDYLHPLNNISHAGITINPPTLNWSTAQHTLDQACETSLSLLSTTTIADVNKHINTEQIVDRKMKMEVEAVEKQHRQTTQKEWENIQYKLIQQQRQTQQTHTHIIQDIADMEQQRISTHSNHRQQREKEQFYFNTRAAEQRSQWEMAKHRQQLHESAYARLTQVQAEERERYLEACRIDAEEQHAAHLDSVRRREKREAAERERQTREYEDKRMMAKMARVEVRIVRVDQLDDQVIPSKCSAFFALQIVNQIPAATPLAYPTPATPLMFTSFFQPPTKLGKTGVGAAATTTPATTNRTSIPNTVAVPSVTSSVSPPVATAMLDLSSCMTVKNIGSTSLIVSYQACDEQQKDRYTKWIKKKHEQREQQGEEGNNNKNGKNGSNNSSNSNTRRKTGTTTIIPQHRLTGQKQSTILPSISTNRNQQRQNNPSRQRSVSDTATPPPLTASAATLAATTEVADLIQHRHRCISRTLEVGRLEWKLRDLRAQPDGILRVKAHVFGMAWYKKKEKEQQRQSKRNSLRPEQQQQQQEQQQRLSSPSPPGSEQNSSRSDRLSVCSPDSVEDNTDRVLLSARARFAREQGRLESKGLTLLPSSLFPARRRSPRNQLELMLMTEKEREKWLEEEERRERVNREREAREQQRWRKLMAIVWIEIRVIPLEQSGLELKKEEREQTGNKENIQHQQHNKHQQRVEEQSARLGQEGDWTEQIDMPLLGSEYDYGDEDESEDEYEDEDMEDYEQDDDTGYGSSISQQHNPMSALDAEALLVKLNAAADDNNKTGHQSTTTTSRPGAGLSTRRERLKRTDIPNTSRKMEINVQKAELVPIVGKEFPLMALSTARGSVR